MTQANTEAVHVIAALLLTCALSLLPGLALARCLVPGLSLARALAVAPAISSGVLYALGQAATFSGLPVDWGLGASVLVAASVALAVRPAARVPLTSGLPRPVAASAAAGSVVCAALWITAIGSLTAVPAHDDGYNHAVMVARVLAVQSLAPAELQLPSPVEESTAGFYPLALHQQAAMVVQATGVDVGLALTVVTLVPVVLCLPLGMALLTRRLFPGQVLVAAGAPLLVAVQPVLMYSMSWWGGLTMAVGLSVVPALLDVLLEVTHALRPAGAAFLATGLVGVVGLHTSEVPLLAVVGTTLVLAQPLEGPLQALRRTAVLAVPFVLAAALLVPVLAQLAGVYQHTVTVAPGRVGAVPVLEALGRVLLLQVGHPPAAPAAMGLAAWIGLVYAAVRGGRAPRVWTGLCVVVGVLTFWLWAWPGPVINTLTSVFFSSAPRMTYLLVLLLLPLLTVGLVLPLHRWSRRVTDQSLQRPSLRSTAATAGVLVLGFLFIVTSVSATVSGVRKNYREYSLAGPDERAAFRFLSRQVRSDERVLNQIQDGSPWMYPLEGVQPLIAGKSDTYEAQQWAGIRQLLANVGRADREPAVADMLRRHRISFVYVNERVFPGRRRELRLEALKASAAFREVFVAGGAHVFAVREERLANPPAD